jgi:hypothetical protein
MRNNNVSAQAFRCCSRRANDGGNKRMACSASAAANMHLASSIARRVHASVVVAGLSARA